MVCDASRGTTWQENGIFDRPLISYFRISKSFVVTYKDLFTFHAGFIMYAVSLSSKLII